MTIQNENEAIENSNLPIRDSRPQHFSRAFNSLDISEATKKDYLSRLPVFTNFIKTNGFDQNTYLTFKKWLATKNMLSVSTKNKHLIVARILLKQLHRLGHLPTDITVGIKQFNEIRKHKKNGLTKEEVKRLSDYLHYLPDNRQNLRIQAIISLLIFQGLRQIEVARLNVSDIDPENMTAMILGKGQDDKEKIDLHPQCVKSLKSYIKITGIKDAALFYCNSNFRKNQRLTTRSIRKIVKEVFKKIRIERTVHGTRHFFVTRLIEEYKGDLTTVMNYTRHRSLETLKIYDDSIKQKEDLPRFYKTFHNIQF